MPLFDFRCPSCGTIFESLKKPGEPARCPCGTEAHSLPSAPAFVLKGAGWVDKGRPVAGKTRTS